MTVTLLPEGETVFVDPEEASRYLLPLATIDLSDAVPHLSGPLHFVTPIDPCDGVVGEFTSAFYSETCKSNWVGFKVVDGRYELDADYQFFEQRYYENHPVSESIHESVRDTWIEQVDEHYAKTTSEYERVVSGYRSGELTDDDLGLCVELGGLPVDSNWSNMGGNFPIEFVHSEQEDQWTKHPYPLTNSGRRYRYIGTVESDHVRAGRFLQCMTVLFYDARTKRAILTFDWT